MLYKKIIIFFSLLTSIILTTQLEGALEIINDCTTKITLSQFKLQGESVDLGPIILSRISSHTFDKFLFDECTATINDTCSLTCKFTEQNFINSKCGFTCSCGRFQLVEYPQS